MHETTGIGATYNPPPSVENKQMQERWAEKLATPGGWAGVDRQITRTVKLNEGLDPKRTGGRFKTREQLAQPEQAGRSQQQIAASAAAQLRRDRRETPQPAQRPGPATPGGGQTQTQQQSQTH